MTAFNQPGVVSISDLAHAYPPGDYAIVEFFGHARLVGRITEVDRFGTKMLAIEPLFCDSFLPAIYHGGTSIYRLTPCSAETAYSRQPRSAWFLPEAVRAIVPPLLLAASKHGTVHDVEDPDDAETGGDGDDKDRLL